MKQQCDRDEGRLLECPLQLRGWIFEHLWGNKNHVFIGVSILMLWWKYTPLYEKAWKITKTVQTETTRQMEK